LTDFPADFAARPHPLEEWLGYQQRVHPAAIDLSLDRVRSVASGLELLRPACPVAIVGGTNGKGSTATMLAAMLRACGRRVGLFTSPHLLRYTERVQIDGEAVSEQALVGAFERIERARGATTLTYFEYSTLGALQVFRDARVEALVLEVGLGGRLDATNILDADVAVLCSVGLDHRDWLGDTLEAIGREKAGIFRAGRPVVLGSADMPSSVWDAVNALGCRVSAAGREFHWTWCEPQATAGDWEYEGPGCRLAQLPPPALAGTVQYANAASALTALLLLGIPGACEPQRLAQALRGLHLPGRLQIAQIDGVEWILDVAHNGPAAEVLAQALAARPSAGRTLAVAGVLADKDAVAIARALDPQVDQWILAGLTSEARGQSAEALAARLGALRAAPLLSAGAVQACEQARQLARRGDRIVVLGSFHVVGPALDWLGLY
jgi:dihydrofolate synthase/folylpolyglutamate synthase